MTFDLLRIDWNCIVAIVTAVAAVSALFGVKKQLDVDNKQFLFERRLAAYFRLKMFVSTFEKSAFLLKVSDKAEFTSSCAVMAFGFMCNNSELQAVSGKDAFLTEGSMHVAFLSKRAEVYDFADTLPFLFPDFDVMPAVRFLKNYMDVVHTLRGCGILDRDYKAEVDAIDPVLRGVSGRSYSDLVGQVSSFLDDELYWNKVRLMQQFLDDGSFSSACAYIEPLLVLR